MRGYIGKAALLCVLGLALLACSGPASTTLSTPARAVTPIPATTVAEVPPATLVPERSTPLPESIPTVIPAAPPAVTPPKQATTPAPVPTPIPRPSSTATPRATPPAASPTPASDPEWAALPRDLQALVSSWDGQNAVSITDLQTGRTITINGSRQQLAACTIKIPILMVVAQDIEAGRYSAESVDSLVRSAMGPSNTWPARELLRIAGNNDVGAGIARVNALMQQLGMRHSQLSHPPGYSWEEYDHGDHDNLLTTDDLVLLLGKLYRGEALSPAATKYVLWSMTLAPDWVDASLGSPLPGDVALYHKFGQLYAPENTWNDAGVVVFSRGNQRYAYAIAYLGSYGAGWHNAYDHATAVSARTWRYFNARYPASRS